MEIAPSIPLGCGGMDQIVNLVCRSCVYNFSPSDSSESQILINYQSRSTEEKTDSKTTIYLLAGPSSKDGFTIHTTVQETMAPTNDLIQTLLSQTTKPALLIVDMQNTFCHANGIFNSTTAAIPESTLNPVISNIQKLQETFRASSLPILFCGYAFNPDYSDSGILLDPPLTHLKDLGFCLRGSWDAEIISSLRPEKEEDFVFVEKTRNSGFQFSKMDEVLKEQKIDGLFVTGVSTNVCVESTVRDAVGYGYRTLTVGDATGCMSKEEQEGSERSLKWFGVVVGTEDVVRALEERKF